MFKHRKGSAVYGSKSGVLPPAVKQATDVAVKPKALPYWLRVNLRKLVELYIKVSINI